MTYIKRPLLTFFRYPPPSSSPPTDPQRLLVSILNTTLSKRQMASASGYGRTPGGPPGGPPGGRGNPWSASSHNSDESPHNSDKENPGGTRRTGIGNPRAAEQPRGTGRASLPAEQPPPYNNPRIPGERLPTYQEVLDQLTGGAPPSDSDESDDDDDDGANATIPDFPSWQLVVELLSIDQVLTHDDVRHWFPAIKRKHSFYSPSIKSTGTDRN